MNILDNLIADGLNKYLNRLVQYGKMDYSAVYDLLFIIMIRDVLYSSFRNYVNEKDYRLFSDALSCIYGRTCLIDYPEYINDDMFVEDLWLNRPDKEYRISELDILRLSEKDIVRASSK